MTLYKHILVPTDLSKNSGTAAQRAKSLSETLGAKLTVLHIINYIPPRQMAAELPASLASESALFDRAGTYLSEWLDKQGLSDCEHVIKIGSPKTEIVNAANDLSVDLIVMGTHGETGLARVIGSNTNAVIHHAECDVLTTPMVR